MSTILVTGATGHYGQATITSLLNKGVKPQMITALVRDESKAETLKELGVNIVYGNYEDYNSLVRAFSDIEKLVLVSGSDLEKRTEQQLNVVKAAKEAGVQHILYTSVERKTERETSPIQFVLGSHLATEKAIKESGMTYTLLRNNLYMDLLPWFLGENVLENGIYLPAGSGKIGFALRAEMAESAANILITEGHENKSYTISGEAVSFEEIAKILSEISGKEVSYTSPDPETYIQTVTTAGMPEMFANMFGGFSQAGSEGELNSENSDMERLMGRKPTSVTAFLKQLYQ